MQNSLNNTQKRTTFSFWFATLSLITLFAASASPIPLYSVYRSTIGLTTESISLTAVFYFIGCIISLIFFSRLSNYLGRKPVAISANVIGMIGLVILLKVNSPIVLIMARFFQGLACGLASSVMSVFIVESGEKKPISLVNAISGSAVLVGLAIGGLLSGTFVQFFSNGSSLIYIVLSIVLLICLLGILIGKDSITKRKGAIESLFPQVKIPRKSKKYLLPSVGVFAATWAIGGYFQAFSSTIGTSIFEFNSPIISAIILASFMAPNFIGSSLSGHFKEINGEKIGIAVFMICIFGMYVSFLIGSFLLFLLTSVLAGISQGIAYTNAMQLLLKHATGEEKAGIISVIYLVSYGGAAIPNFIFGRLSEMLNFQQITLSYLIIVCLLGLITLISKPDKNPIYK